MGQGGGPTTGELLGPGIISMRRRPLHERWLEALIDPRCRGYYEPDACMAQTCDPVRSIYCGAHAQLHVDVFRELVAAVHARSGVVRCGHEWLDLVGMYCMRS